MLYTLFHTSAFHCDKSMHSSDSNIHRIFIGFEYMKVREAHIFVFQMKISVLVFVMFASTLEYNQYLLLIVSSVYW